MIFGELSAKVSDFRSQFSQSRVIGAILGTALIVIPLMLIDDQSNFGSEIDAIVLLLTEFFGGPAWCVIFLFFILLWFFRKKPKKIFCTWCGGKKSGLTKETEHQDEWEWVWSNKDGSQDLRKKTIGRELISGLIGDVINVVHSQRHCMKNLNTLTHLEKWFLYFYLKMKGVIEKGLEKGMV